MTEFSLIAWLKQQASADQDVVIGIGDDAAVVRPRQGYDLLVTADSMVEGVHFLPGSDPVSIGHKALAVSLSDIAAMGGKPRWVVVTVAMPKYDEAWFKSMIKSLLSLAEQHGIRLIGGDLTRGPLTITTVVHGEIKQGQSITQSGAKPGDGVYVAGFLGAAAGGLLAKQGQLNEENDTLVNALDYPDINVTLGQSLVGIASAMIDLSDGLLIDLGHIAEASGVAVRLTQALIPCHPALPKEIGLECACHGGDDYVLCFTASPHQEEVIHELMAQHPITQIGSIEVGSGVRVVDYSGKEISFPNKGWEHFNDETQY